MIELHDIFRDACYVMHFSQWISWLWKLHIHMAIIANKCCVYKEYNQIHTLIRYIAVGLEVHTVAIL